MTWSIIARDTTTGQIGIAVATKFFAVGARVPHIAAGIGGIATQALVNPYYGIDGVKLLREGRLPHDIIDPRHPGSNTQAVYPVLDGLIAGVQPPSWVLEVK